MDYSCTQIEDARNVVAARIRVTPRIGLILGSGLGALADEMDHAVVVPYQDIPCFAAPTIAGHRAELAVGVLAGQPVAVLCGRLHFYEGYTMQQVTFPVRLLHALGCEVLVVTCAAGGLHSEWHAGDIMQITDQIFLPGMAGHHPLRGEHDERLGLRFPPMVGAFDNELAYLASRAAKEQGITLRAGVYVMLSGPAFESSAELRMLRGWGADAVGMSTAPEVVVARQAGMRILGLALITNLALPEGAPANHEEVLDMSGATAPRLGRLICRILELLG